MTFDFEKLLNKPVGNEPYTVKLDSGDNFMIRRMNGTEYTDFITAHHNTGITSAVILPVLANCVLFGIDTGSAMPIREKKAKKLLDTLPNIARELVIKIFNDSAEYNEHLNEEVKIAEKN
ncbi:MAG: hypothetical protein LBT46_15485 [Planctomycetaceae bacterium]|jgi:hypothetical protein|nr:hypothetical protein [Planctomycetaceae bacterium]